ncbi:MipA/OmpV family protein [Pseudoalteromonas mariniglutinosa]|uniref:MipA/OmpV family protein n=1 Tax=Pseudoalteromonas mariniglutinosa TaxID=206042 RepID=UPI00384ABB5B
MNRVTWYIISLILFFSPLLSAEENRGDVRERLEPKGFIYGFGLGINQELYSGYDRRVVPLPILGYRGERLNVLGPFISYDVVQNSGFKFTLQAAPRFQGFDSSDSDIFIGMQERDFSFDAGLGLKYQRDDWNIAVSSMFDVLNKSDGYELKTTVGRAFKYGPIFIEPTLSVSYLNDKNVNYYYGVADFEARSFRPAYQASSAVNTTIGVSLATPIFFGGFTRLSVDYTFNDSSITDSPLVDRDNNLSLRLFYSHFF